MHGLLRRATADRHQRLDQGLGYVLDERLSVARYADLVAAFLGFYAPLEESLSRWQAASATLGLPIIWRAPLLQQDLRVLSRAAEPHQTCAEVPAFTTPNQVAGALYVVEGASLGGQVIARGLMRRLGIGRENGAAFFIGDGAQTAVRWKQVLAWLEERGRDPRNRGEIVATACVTFDVLASWLAARGVLDA
jgi:heme oxygenase (biliverdin-IX-beta and delta-forming)